MTILDMCIIHTLVKKRMVHATWPGWASPSNYPSSFALPDVNRVNNLFDKADGMFLKAYL
jgi:hypothetical protein